MHLAYRWFTWLDFEQEIPDNRRSPRTGMDVFFSRSTQRLVPLEG